LNSKGKINAIRNGSNEPNIFLSAGETLADGSMIEILSGSPKPDLLLWNGRKAIIGPRVEHRGRIYEAPALSPGLYRAVRLPSECTEYGSARDLLDGVTGLFKHHCDLPERESSLLACFAIGTWLADYLPSAPSLIISGAEQELGIDVLRVLSCVCRHSLMLADVTAGAFRSLPMEVGLTLLLIQQDLKPNLERLLRASSHRGLHLPGNRGSVVDPYGPKAIFCGDGTAVDILGGGAIQISLAAAHLQPNQLNEKAQSEIANHFQPRLLMYRLKNAPKVRRPQIDVSEFTPATGRLAMTLTMYFPEDLRLARDVVQLLRPQDQEIRERRFFDVNYAIVEILLDMIHRKECEVRVAELAAEVTALLRSRGEIFEYLPEEIGWKLRDLNIPRHSSSSGRQVVFGRDLSQRVHRLAKDYNLQSPQGVQVCCPDCSNPQA
jgi:hypothetical protein